MIYDIDLSEIQTLMTKKGFETLKIDSRYLISYGGAGSGKSYSIAQKVLFRILTEEGHRILVVRKTARSLKRSVFQLFRDIISDWNLSELFSINLTDYSISCKGNQNQILMSGLDDVEKLKSIAGITGIWIEEVSEITADDFTQLDLRLRGHTKNYKQIILTFNPTSSQSWLKKRFFDRTDPQATIIHSTFDDNQFIDSEYKSILANLSGQNQNLFDIYSKGVWGNRKGLIYTDFTIVDVLPTNYEFQTYGIDFGFNHPQALIEARIVGDSIYAKEHFYQSQTLVSDLISYMKQNGISKDARIFADSANPDKIVSIQNAGYRRCIGAKKDVLSGVDYIKSKKLFVTSDSVNLLKELNTYSWKLDKNGDPTEAPVKLFDDCLDGLRYATFSGEKIKISLAKASNKKRDEFSTYSDNPFRNTVSDSRFRGFE